MNCRRAGWNVAPIRGSDIDSKELMLATQHAYLDREMKMTAGWLYTFTFVDVVYILLILLLDQMCFVFSLANQEVDDLELDDAELLAGLEAQEVVERVEAVPVHDSGYRTLSETSTQCSISYSVRSLVSAASSRWVVNSVMS